MNNNYESFEIFGGHDFKGSLRTLNGEFRTFSDNKLIGLMFDENRNKNPQIDKTKLVIGIEDKNFRINFLVISEDETLSPLFYTLENIEDTVYDGSYIPAEVKYPNLINSINSIHNLTEIKKTFSKSSIDDKLNTLSKINKKDILTYLNPLIIQFYFQYNKNPAYLELNSFIE